ncbi:ribonuclease domain-containing protein [Streptomyces sp. NPDC002004]
MLLRPARRVCPAPLRPAPRGRAALVLCLAALLTGLLSGLLSGCSPTATTHPATGGRSASAGSAASAAAVPTPGWARGMRTVAVGALPPEARETLRLIDRGGPFPYAKDGVVFGNFERRLPQHPRGYYHEYTVRTPGSQDRGARRIVTGTGGETYYTDDHYASFKAVLR